MVYSRYFKVMCLNLNKIILIVLFPLYSVSAELACKTFYESKNSLTDQKQVEETLYENLNYDLQKSPVPIKALLQAVPSVIYKLQRGDSFVLTSLQLNQINSILHLIETTQFIAVDGIAGKLPIVKAEYANMNPTLAKGFSVNRDGTFYISHDIQLVPLYMLKVTKVF